MGPYVLVYDGDFVNLTFDRHRKPDMKTVIPAKATAKVSFRITWSPGSAPKHLHVDDTANGFGGFGLIGIGDFDGAA